MRRASVRSRACWPGSGSRSTPEATPASCSRTHRRRVTRCGNEAVSPEVGLMKFGRRRKERAVEVRGTAKVDRRTKDLPRRLVAGDTAVIDNADIDRVAA